MIYAFDVNKLDVVCKNAKRIILTDSVKYYTVKFKFSDDWEHFSKTAYFINKSNDIDEKDISVPMFLGENETMCLIPWEVLTREGQLVVSIQGVQDDTEIWTKMNRPIVLQKSDKDSDTMPEEPTIPIYNQLLNKLDSKGDSIQFEDDTLSLKSGDKVLSTTKIKDETKDYESLKNIPKLNDIEIKGDKTANDYNIGNDLKVDEAKVTYKGEEISFKDVITQYLKDNENVAKLIKELAKNKAKKFDANSPLSKEIGEGENADILKLKDKSVDKQFLTQSIVDTLENIENIDFADYSEYSTEDNFYDLSQLDENKTILVNKAGYVGIANSILYDWQAEEPTEKQNNVIYVNSNSFITVNKGNDEYRSIYFIADENQYYFEKLISDDDWKLYKTNLNAPYQTWQFAEQLDKIKQNTLISGENIKTINNESVLGKGNIELSSSPITVINDEKYTIRQEGLFYFTKDAEMGYINGNWAPGQGFVFTKNVYANTLVYKKDFGKSTTLIYFTPFEPFEEGSDQLTSGLNFEYVYPDGGTRSMWDICDFENYINYLFTVLSDVGYQDTNRIIITKEHDYEDGTFSFDTIGIGTGLKLENEELSVNTNNLDISKSTFKYNTVDGTEQTAESMTQFGTDLMELFDDINDKLNVKGWATLKNETILEDTEHYTLSNLNVGEYYIWLSKDTPINTGVQGSLTINLFGTNITLGNLETDSKNILIHIIKQSDDYALLDWSTITPNTTFGLSNNRNFGLFPTPITSNSITIRTSAGNISSRTKIKVWQKSEYPMNLSIENGDNLKYGTSTTAEETNENEVVDDE